MKILLPLLSLLLVTLGAQAQKSGNLNYNIPAEIFGREPLTQAVTSDSKEMVITVNGIYNAPADEYVAVFNIIQLGETAEQTDRLMNERIIKFTQALSNLHLDTAGVKIDMISFVPKYEIRNENKAFSKSFNEVPDGFELQKNILIRFKKSSTLDQLVSTAASAEIYDLVKVDYFVIDIDKPMEMLRDKCLAALKGKAKVFEALGMKSESMNKIIADDFQVAYPISRYAAYNAFARPSMDALRKTSSSFLKFNESYKPTTRYYSPVSYDNYDVVINPVIDEPVIQLSYSLTVRYITPEAKGSDYMIVTPNGEVKRLPLP